MHIVLAWLKGLGAKVAGLFVAFMAGKQHEKRKAIERENKKLSDNAGQSDTDLAKRLRRRAFSKRDNER